MGARTPLSGMIAAGAVVLIASALGPFLTRLRMPAIAGVLALVGIGMIQGRERRPFRIEGAVFLVTLLSVLFLGLEVGLFMAILASVVFFVASVSKVDLAISQDGDQERIVVGGNLYYASLDRLAKHLRSNPAARTVLN